MVRYAEERFAEERFAMERMATRGFGSKKIAAALGVPLSTTQRWLQRLRSDGDMASRNVGRPRGAEAGVCQCPCVFRFTSLETRFVCGSRVKQERARAASLINAWIAVEACCTVASVCKRLQASGIERSRRSVQDYVSAEHWPAKQVTCG